jgi:hypothetical protein
MELNAIRPHFLWRARADRALAPTAPAHNQLFLAVYPMELLAAHHMASRDNPVILLTAMHGRSRSPRTRRIGGGGIRTHERTFAAAGFQESLLLAYGPTGGFSLLLVLNRDKSGSE